MQIQKQEIDKNHDKLTVQFDIKKTNQALSKVTRHIGKEIRIHGFMPNKIPLSLIEQRVGKEYIQNEALHKILEQSMSSILKEYDESTIVEPPTLSEYEFKADGLSVSLSVKTVPSMELPELENIKLDVPKVKEDALSREEVIRGIRLRNADWEKIDDETVGLQKYYRFTISSSLHDENGELVDTETLNRDEEEIIFGDEFPRIKQIESLLEGAKVGDKKEKQKFIAEEHFEDIVPNKSYFFNFEIIDGFEKPILPELDKEFAEKQGCETIEEFYERVDSEIEKTKANELSHREDIVISAFLIQNAKMEMPNWLIEDTSKRYIAEKNVDEEMSGSYDKHLLEEYEEQISHKMAEITEEDINSLSEEEKKDIENKAKGRFIVKNLCDKLQISISQEEYKSAIQQWYQFAMILARLQRQDAKPQLTEKVAVGIKRRLQKEKAFREIKKHIKINYIDETTESMNNFLELDKMVDYVGTT